MYGAYVIFYPESGGRRSAGLTDKEGKFELSCFSDRDGALVGKHQVAVVMPDPATVRPMGAAGGGGAPTAPGTTRLRGAKWVIPERYAYADTSGLTARVSMGSNAFDFDLSVKPEDEVVDAAVAMGWIKEKEQERQAEAEKMRSATEALDAEGATETDSTAEDPESARQEEGEKKKAPPSEADADRTETTAEESATKNPTEEPAESSGTPTGSSRT
jgi:hypothetical protein